MGRRADGSLVLFDYGCVLKITRATHYPIAAGTDDFQAPEARMGDVSVQSEIYSLAMTLIALATPETLHRYARALLAATGKHPWNRPKSYAAFRALLDDSDTSFVDTVRLYARLWRTEIACLFAAPTVITVAYGAMMSCNDLLLRKEVRTNYTPAFLTISLVEDGFRELGNSNLTNGFNHLERATQMGNFDSLDYRRAEVYNALHYCHSHGIGTKTNKVKGAFYRRKARELKRPVGP